MRYYWFYSYTFISPETNPDWGFGNGIAETIHPFFPIKETEEQLREEFVSCNYPGAKTIILHFVSINKRTFDEYVKYEEGKDAEIKRAETTGSSGKRKEKKT